MNSFTTVVSGVEPVNVAAPERRPSIRSIGVECQDGYSETKITTLGNASREAFISQICFLYDCVIQVAVDVLEALYLLKSLPH